MNLDVSKLFIISGPSGSGQDSVIEELQKRIEIERVITTTTREMRLGEENGKPYYFVSQDFFKEQIKEDYFFEWAQHYNDNYYGVSFEEIKRVANSGKIGIWKIDKKGVEAAKKLLPEIKAILLYAPLNELEERIRRRDNNLSEEYIQERMAYTKKWLEDTSIYNFKVLNSDGKLQETVNKVLEII